MEYLNKGFHSHQRLQPPPDGELVNPEGTQEAKEHLPTCCLAAIRLQPLPTVTSTAYWLSASRLLGSAPERNAHAPQFLSAPAFELLATAAQRRLNLAIRFVVSRDRGWQTGFRAALAGEEESHVSFQLAVVAGAEAAEAVRPPGLLHPFQIIPQTFCPVPTEFTLPIFFPIASSSTSALLPLVGVGRLLLRVDMRSAFGKPQGTVARVHFGHIGQVMSIHTKLQNKEYVIEALCRAKFKFTGCQKIHISKNWGFTKFNMDEFENIVAENRPIPDGCGVK
ncbi:hypothetical protein J1605_012742 [Eschrichtius robustus]|uniref:60S ribosomal protein L10-like n=1 Tax=Eschrichtius robustus TaxID=9764 RepID=A0AB34GLE8_ESCRO|nr:hypothetical protein J1605_012742 [Eschrichtius robustus]